MQHFKHQSIINACIYCYFILAWFKLTRQKKWEARIQMKWLEIVSLRTAGVNETEARKSIAKFCRIVNKHNASTAYCYLHSTIPGDLALVIMSNDRKDKILGTDLGKYMADILKQFGLVDYNCWEMMNHE